MRGNLLHRLANDRRGVNPRFLVEKTQARRFGEGFQNGAMVVVIENGDICLGLAFVVECAEPVAGPRSDVEINDSIQKTALPEHLEFRKASDRQDLFEVGMVFQ